MEKLDGDLTDYILKNSYKKVYGVEDDYKFFYDRLPKTTDKYERDTIDINDNEQIKQTKLDNINKQKEIIDNVRKYIFEICYSLNTDIIFLHHQILKKGWLYQDLKFDNLGYNKNNDELQLFFIDEESGLKKIKSLESLKFEEYLNLHSLNTCLGSYGILGQDNLKNIFGRTNFKNLVFI